MLSVMLVSFIRSCTHTTCHSSVPAEMMALWISRCFRAYIAVRKL
jgi:hypothetical protein